MAAVMCSGPARAGRRTTLGFLQRHPVLGAMPGRALAGLADVLEVRRVSRGECLWRPGEPPSAVAWIRTGVVRLSRPDAGREMTVDYFGRGDLIGWHGQGGAGREDGAEVHEDAVLLAARRADVDAWLAEHPEAAPRVLDQLGVQASRLQARLSLVCSHGAKRRLAGLWLALGQRFGARDSRGLIVDLRLTHRELAALIGATRETVSVTVVEMREEGLVRTERRRAILVDEPGLRAVAAG